MFLTFARKEYISFAEGQPSLIDAEKIKALTDLGLEWKQPAHVPRKNTGGEASRKKKPKIEVSSRDQDFVAAADIFINAKKASSSRAISQIAANANPYTPDVLTEPVLPIQFCTRIEMIRSHGRMLNTAKRGRTCLVFYSSKSKNEKAPTSLRIYVFHAISHILLFVFFHQCLVL